MQLSTIALSDKEIQALPIIRVMHVIGKISEMEAWRAVMRKGVQLTTGEILERFES